MKSSSALRIERVESAQQMKDFFALPERLYGDDPAYVRPLASLAKAQVDPDSHPFYQHATRELFLCYRDQQVVGRVAAIKDDLHNEYYSDSVGFFGLFEAIDDSSVAQLLLSTAENWLRENGCTSIRGPVNPVAARRSISLKGFTSAFFIFITLSHPISDFNRVSWPARMPPLSDEGSAL